MNDAFGQQIRRLRDAGYPQNVLLASCGRLLRKLRQEKQRTTEESRPREERSKVSVIPYVHGLSLRIKKVAENYDVKVVFSAQNKIGSVLHGQTKV